MVTYVNIKAMYKGFHPPRCAIDRDVHLILGRGKCYSFKLYHTTRVIDELLNNFNAESAEEYYFF